MRKKNLKMMLAVCTAAALIFAGCGSKEETAESTETTAAENASEDTDSAAAPVVDASEISEIEVVRPESLGEVKLGEYEGVEVTVTPSYDATDSDVDNYIDYYVLPSYMESVDAPAENGDTVNIDYVGKRNDVAFEGGTAAGYDLVLGSGSFIDGFEDGIVGHKKGDAFSLDLTFPEDYFNEELAGADVVFEVVLNDVKRMPELTDGLAAEIDPECTSAEEYRENVKAMLQEEVDYYAEQELAYQVISKVLSNSEATPTDEAIEWKINDLVVNYYDPMLTQSYGVGLADMLTLQSQTLDEFKESLREVSEETIKQLLVLDAVAEAQGITVGDAEIEQFAEDNGMTVEELKLAGTDEAIEEAVRNELATDYIISKAVVTYGIGGDTAGAETESAETEETAAE